MIRLLFVEDNEIFRDLAQHILSEFDDVEIIGVANNGREAIEFLVNGTMPDLVITDLNMPVMDGLELISKMKEMAMHIPVIVMSMNTTESHLIEVMAAGATGYVAKDDLFELHEHILTVHRGEIAISKEMQKYTEPGS
jgi:DNA-binding NarL/FixJ family response regulator